MLLQKEKETHVKAHFHCSTGSSFLPGRRRVSLGVLKQWPAIKPPGHERQAKEGEAKIGMENRYTVERESQELGFRSVWLGHPLLQELISYHIPAPHREKKLTICPLYHNFSYCLYKNKLLTFYLLWVFLLTFFTSYYNLSACAEDCRMIKLQSRLFYTSPQEKNSPRLEKNNENVCTPN